MVEPVGFIEETGRTTNSFERAVTFGDIEADAPLQLAQTDRAEVQRATIAFGQMIRAVHQAVEKGAVSEAEHVTSFMGEHFTATAEQKRLIIRGASFAVKGRVVPRKAVNADALAQRGLAEHEVPRWLGVKIFHGDRDEAERVGWQAGFQESEHVAGEDLQIAGVRIATGSELARGEWRRRQRFYLHGEKRGREFAQPRDRRAAVSGKITERLKIDHASRRGRPIWMRRFEFVKSLSGFVVDG